MTPITFWFDPLSPYAYLAFERLPQALEGCSYIVEYRPLLLAGLLDHWGQLGPAEIEPKRDWTYRQVAWLAHRDGIALQMPQVHPFNPLPLLRLLMACSEDGRPNRMQCEAVLQHVWTGGAAADDPDRLVELTIRFAPRHDPAGDEVKRRLRDETDAAIARGIFGVPTFEVPAAAGPPRLFWGADAIEMLAASVRGDPWFDARWESACAVAPGAARRHRPR